MSHTFEELKKMTVVHLREIASSLDNDTVKGYSQLNKEHLLQALCKALAIDMHRHHEVKGLDKTTVKNRIAAMKTLRDQAIDSHDHPRLHDIRRRIHRLKRKIHQATK